MSKQTAVEWLFNQIQKDIIGIQIDYADEFNQLFEQAKEMEKQQIKDAYNDAAIDATYGEKFKNFEQYYKETYGGNK